MEIPSAWFLFLKKPRFVKHVGFCWNPQLNCISSASIYRRVNPPAPRLDISSIWCWPGLAEQIHLASLAGWNGCDVMHHPESRSLWVSALSANSIRLCWLLNSISPFGSRSSFSPLEEIEFVRQTKPFFNSHKSTKMASFSPLWLSASKVTEEVTLASFNPTVELWRTCFPFLFLLVATRNLFLYFSAQCATPVAVKPFCTASLRPEPEASV